MYKTHNNNNTNIKKVKIDNIKNIKNNNKRTKKAFTMDNMDYLTQIFRNKTTELKKGGSKNKMEKLLSNNTEIERLLSNKKRTRKNRNQEITSLMEPTNTIEVDLSSKPFLQTVNPLKIIVHPPVINPSSNKL